MTEEERQRLFKRIADRLTWLDNWSLSRYTAGVFRRVNFIRQHLFNIQVYQVDIYNPADPGKYVYDTFIADEFLIKYEKYLSRIIP